MTYSTLLTDALNEVQPFKKKYEEYINNRMLDNDDGMHIVFGYAFAPLLIDAIKDNDMPTIRQLCAFLEKMARCDDLRVQDVCDQSIIEAVAGEYPDDVIVPLFGKNTLEGLMAVREYIWEPEIA